MNANILTKELLEKVHACKEAILLCKITNLFGIDLNKTKFIGDFNNYIKWLNNNIINAKLTFDSNNNLIEKIDPSGKKHTYKYDKNNNMIEKVDLYGYKHTWKYIHKNDRLYQIYGNDELKLTIEI